MLVYIAVVSFLLGASWPFWILAFDHIKTIRRLNAIVQETRLLDSDKQENEEAAFREHCDTINTWFETRPEHK